jgi:trehalose-phosphatase
MLQEPPNLSPSKDNPAVIILDYDGTLTPIVQQPEDAVLSPEHAEILKRLNSLPCLSWALLSGRSVEQLQGFVSPHDIDVPYLAGLHGGELWQANADNNNHWLEQPGDHYKGLSNTFQQQVEDAVDALYPKSTWDSIGIAIEEKAHCFALHYRRAKDDIAQTAEEAFKNLYRSQQAIKEQFRLQPGKKVIEIVPSTFNKGAGIHNIMAAVNMPSAIPIFIGDDLTDEIGFEAVNKLGGFSILVNPTDRDTKAVYRLDDINAVYAWLTQLSS